MREKKAPIMLGEARGENTQFVSPHGNISHHVHECQLRWSSSGEKQVLISGDGDLVIGKGHTEIPEMQECFI